jgi:hypothetical protein
MTAPAPTPDDLDLQRPSHSGRLLRRWPLILTAVISVFLMWQCGSTLRQGRSLANIAAQRFHQELNSGQYEQIYSEADQGFAQPGKHDELVTFLQAVHTKLGDVRMESLLSIHVGASTGGGAFITTQYNTTFARGTGVETFIWVKSRGSLKLYGYNIQSNALVMN